MNTKNKNNKQSKGDFNTDDIPPASGKVGPGYDDTGKGNDAKASRMDEKKNRKGANKKNG